MRGSHLFIWAVILTVVVLLNLPLPAALVLKSGARDGIAPFHNVMSYALERSLSLFSFIPRLRQAKVEKENLLRENAELRYRLAQAEPLERENADLRRLFDFQRRETRGLRLCEVVARGDVSGWWQTVTLNGGSDDGIVVNAPVITGEGLVGRVYAVSRRTSTVLLITDPLCKVACRLVRTDAFGIVRGTGVAFDGDRELEMLYAIEPLHMQYVSADVRVERGDVVVTSGLGGVFPEGLIVGHVLDTVSDASGLYQRSRVVPAADVASLRYVFVVTP